VWRGFTFKNLSIANHCHTELTKFHTPSFYTLIPLLICKSASGRSERQLSGDRCCPLSQFFLPRRLNPSYNITPLRSSIKTLFPSFLTLPYSSTLSVHGSWLVGVGKTIVFAARHQANSSSTCINETFCYIDT
jgi:hypothetical protein